MYHYLLDTSSPDWDLTLQAQGPAPHLVTNNMRMMLMMEMLMTIIMQIEILVGAKLLKMCFGSVDVMNSLLKKGDQICMPSFS